jgi:hypothetical protein
MLFVLIPAAILLSALFGLHMALGWQTPSTVGDVEACLPCYCENDQRINCLGNEYYGVYTRETANGSCYIDVLLIDQATGRGRRGIRLTPREQTRIEDFPEENTLIESYYETSLYRLTTGEWQVNAGPTAEGKVYVVVFTGCPATNVHEYDFIVPTAEPTTTP